AAQAAFADDVSAGLAKSAASSSSPASTSAPRKLAPKPSDPYTNYSTPASLGYKDPDLERFKAEVERKRVQGVVGEWEVVDTPKPASASPPTVEETAIGVKREREESEEDRPWNLKRKTVGVRLGELYDPGVIQIQPKVKEEAPEGAG